MKVTSKYCRMRENLLGVKTVSKKSWKETQCWTSDRISPYASWHGEIHAPVRNIHISATSSHLCKQVKQLLLVRGYINSGHACFCICFQYCIHSGIRRVKQKIAIEADMEYYGYKKSRYLCNRYFVLAIFFTSDRGDIMLSNYYRG